MGYSSSLSDQEWEIIEPLLPRKKKTRPPTWTKRQILDGVFYQLKNGCKVLREIMTALHEQVREQAEKKPKWTTLIIVDSQATKNTCNATEL